MDDPVLCRVKVVECRDDSHCVQINSSPLSVFADVCADFGHRLPDWHAVTDPENNCDDLQ